MQVTRNFLPSRFIFLCFHILVLSNIFSDFQGHACYLESERKDAVSVFSWEDNVSIGRTEFDNTSIPRLQAMAMAMVARSYQSHNLNYLASRFP